MIFGFSGAPDAGKTELTRVVSERLGYAALEIRPGEVLAARSFDLAAPLTRLRRIAAQELLMEHLEEVLRAIQVPTIVDCSPVDLIAWMLCDVGSQDSPALAKRVMGYVESALGLAKRYYNGVIVTRPLGPDRSPANPVNSAFQFHVQCVVESAAGRLRGPLLTRVLRGASLQERADEATEIIDQEEHDFRAELERERLALH